MRKNRLVLLLLLGSFALMGADCSMFGGDDDDDDEPPLPDRAIASSPLLRAYYNTRTFPKGMKELKIPEDKDLLDEEGPLTVEFGMGGTATITSVHTHLLLAPPKSGSFTGSELQCRCIAPNGTKSGWKPIDVDISGKIDMQAEVAFLYEFDGLISDGTWKIELKDALDDEDGRCLFRNGSLHINQGFGTPGGAANETQTLTAAQGLYGQLPERSGTRMPADFAAFGINTMLRNDFTFTTSFYVTQATLRVSFYYYAPAEVESDVLFVLVSPSGNWLAGGLPDDSATYEEIAVSADLSLRTYTLVLGSLPAGPMLNLNGEPSAGTWSLYLADTKLDGNSISVTTDGAAPLFDTNQTLQLTLDGNT